MEFINKHIYDNLTSRRNDKIISSCNFSGKGGPADIKLTEGLILLDGIAIPCTQIGQPEPVRKITAADDFIIPPRSEVIIDHLFCFPKYSILSNFHFMVKRVHQSNFICNFMYNVNKTRSHCYWIFLNKESIEDEALLGLDILMKGKAGPADIKLSEGLMLLDGIAIPCTQIGQPEPVRKITAVEKANHLHWPKH
jgi:hypothetical protein